MTLSKHSKWNYDTIVFQANMEEEGCKKSTANQGV